MNIKQQLEEFAARCREAREGRGDLPAWNGGELKYANLGGADLRYANLGGAQVRCAYLEGADLEGANLRYANMRYANLEGANLEGINLEGAYLEGAYMERANLQYANMRDAKLEGVYLRGAKLYGADLRGADLHRADLWYEDLRGAKGIKYIPLAPIPGLAALVLEQITEHPETWVQDQWHCETGHCCAGWAVVLAGEVGRAAENRLGTAMAAKMLLGGENHPFRSGDRGAVIPWLSELAGEEVKQ